jgi:hypothetical protein
MVSDALRVAKLCSRSRLPIIISAGDKQKKESDEGYRRRRSAILLARSGNLSLASLDEGSGQRPTEVWVVALSLKHAKYIR